MRKLKKYAGWWRFVFCCCFLLGTYGIAIGSEKRPVFDVITIDSPITPPIAEYILQSIQDSSARASDGLIILLDTPGGLDTSMREIAKGILNAPLPVIVFVHPAGARAASAGVIITISAHVAAMSPGTNIGAAHPVSVGGGEMNKTMSQKVENDAAAYVKGIAKKKGRNETWVAQSVLQSESITAEEALKLEVIDIVAVNIDELLRQMDGRRIVLPRGEITLATRNAEVKERDMGLRLKILSVISNPNIAYLLFLAGIAGLYFEFSNPGAILPGVVGGISLILAFFALQTLPVNYAGVLLILFAVILFIAEIKVMSYGLLTVGGIISLFMGSLLLFDSPEPALKVSLQVLVPTVVVLSLFFIVVTRLIVKAQLSKAVTGKEGLKDAVGISATDISPASGTVIVEGEYWRAVSDTDIAANKSVRVKSVEGLTLRVEKID
jgi:membrane-bound serine protease (ClpP class)